MPIYMPGKVVLKKDGVTTGLLDAYGGAAAAYSLRQLSANYGGAVVRVRRSSDNTEQDFTTTQVTDGTLTTFCGAGDGFVRTLYDQSGNANNAGQATSASQPQIVSAGSLILEASKPVMRFDGSDDFLLQVNNTTINQPFTTVIATKRNSGSSTDQNIFRSPSAGAVLYWIGNSGNLAAFAGSVYDSSSSSTNNILSFLTWSGSSSTFGLNSSTSTVNVGGSYLVSNEPLRIGRGVGATDYSSMSLREFIIYPSSQAANRAGINSNINAHYAIY
jgi:hypothetical protein